MASAGSIVLENYIVVLLGTAYTYTMVYTFQSAILHYCSYAIAKGVTHTMVSRFAPIGLYIRVMSI